jgi:hypothetical protein
MVDPIAYQDDIEQPIVNAPFPLGERRADDVRDAAFLMADAVPLPPLTALPTYRYYGVYGSLTGDTRYTNTPLSQMLAHAKGNPNARDPLGNGHCVGYSMKHLLLCHPIVNKAPTLSGSDIYHLAQTMDEWDGTAYQGTSVRAGLKALQSLGFIGGYLWTSSPATVAQWLLSGRGPVCIGSSWYGGMDFPNKASGYRIAPTGTNRGGHAYIIDGVNQALRRFRILNSWGPTWGQNGRAFLTWDDLQFLMSERANAAASPVEYVR